MTAELLNTEKLSNEHWLNLFARTFRYGERTFRWLFASRKADPTASRKPDAVLLVPILLPEPGDEPRLVVTREWRVPLWDFEYGLPAGLIDGDESPEDAARRELMEETGFELVEIQKLSPPNYSSTGLTDESVVMVFCTCRKPADHRQHLDGAEQIEVLPKTIGELAELVDAQAPINGRAWMAVYMFHRLGRLL